MELWRDVPGYEGLYQVSNYGRVRGVERQIIWRKRVKTIKEKIMKLYYNEKNGYLYVRLCKNSIATTFLVHNLIAKVFIPNPNNYDVVHHIDHNPLNNMVDNLEWINRKNHQALHNTEKEITVYQYTLDGELLAVWESATIAAKELGISQGDIWACCNGGFMRKGKWVNRIQYKGYKWSYIPL